MPREKGEESGKRMIIIALEKSRWIPFPLLDFNLCLGNGVNCAKLF
jgi:hypothetical protein